MWGCKVYELSTFCVCVFAAQWFDVWKGLAQLAHYRKQRMQVFFFPGQVRS
jgi:hypothetical protein